MPEFAQIQATQMGAWLVEVVSEVVKLYGRRAFVNAKPVA